MNDRASAVPPVHFLGPHEREALEGPIYADDASAGAFGASYFGAYEDKQPQLQPQVQQVPARKPVIKTSILGQVWEGVRGKFRLRRDADERDRARAEKKKKDRGLGATQEEMPSRDEVFANYQQLVASGFFSSHAIQSTRHGPPPNHRPSTAHGTKGAHCTPQWPLAPRPFTPKAQLRQEFTPEAVCSPVSAASSRGTKRAAEDSPSQSVDENADEERDDGEDHSTLAHRFLPKRLRKSASRDISLPKLRSVTSRKNMRAAVAASRRSLSMGAQEREPNKLIKRAPLGLQFGGAVPEARASLDVPPGGRNSSDVYGSVTRRIRRPTSARNLRSVARERPVDGGLKVVPDVNRGIPSVPDIPAKFTYGEDRENGEPWRGLRR
jgi:hypothetical protein